jgi:hypothetical protein
MRKGEMMRLGGKGVRHVFYSSYKIFKQDGMKHFGKSLTLLGQALD